MSNTPVEEYDRYITLEEYREPIRDNVGNVIYNLREDPNDWEYPNLIPEGNL